MRRVTLIRGARQLLTLRGPAGPRRGADLRNLGLIQDGAVLVVDGLVHEVGSSRRLENLALARQAEEIDASGCVVMPGFVDSHTHLVAGPARAADYEMQLAGASYDEIAEAGGGALALARSIQELSFRTLETLATRALEQAVRHGTTALEAKSGFGLTEAGETKILRVHAALQRQPVPVISTFLCARVAPGYENQTEEYLEWVCARVLPSVKRRNLAEFADIRCEADAFDARQTCRYLAAARQLGFGLKIHAGPGSDAQALRLAVELGVTSIDHLIDAAEAEIALLARSHSIATLLPGAAFYLGAQRFASARRLIDSGVAVALATNYNPETSPSQNMQMMIALACRTMNMTPAEAITAATLNSAYALGRASSIGSLETGKSADLLILCVPDYREIPYHFGVNLVDLVMKSGSVLVQRSEVQWPVH
ncbi:MAG TPA: imidazolonepropionase [Bryobacteraceae bacterium]|nr:imidazolonepropionase [Bryobacteraceae bacterium]